MAVLDNPLYTLSGTLASDTANTYVEVPIVAVGHQLTIAAGTALAGTVTVTVKPVGASEYETVRDYLGGSIVYNAATSGAQLTFPAIPVRAGMFRFAVAGANGTFTYTLSGTTL